MVRAREWSEEELEKLERLYTSNMPFDEVLLEFPDRTSNAIRLKASRMGFRRPTILGELIQTKRVKFQSLDNKFSKGYLINCNECGAWIQVDVFNDSLIQTISCPECNSLYQLLAEL